MVTFSILTYLCKISYIYHEFIKIFYIFYKKYFGISYILYINTFGIFYINTKLNQKKYFGISCILYINTFGISYINTKLNQIPKMYDKYIICKENNIIRISITTTY